MRNPQTEPLIHRSCFERRLIPERLGNGNGFTLIELMLAVAIVGILSSIAIPNYFEFIEKARLARAIAELNGLAKEVQGFALSFDQYPDTLAQINRHTLRDPWGNLYQYYRINCGAALLGRLDDQEPPAIDSAAPVLPVTMGSSQNDAQFSFAADTGEHQELLHLVQGHGGGGAGGAGGGGAGAGGAGGGGAGGGGGPPCGGIGGARKDRFLVPINSDFDLYSMGKDGASVGPLTAKKSQDDVIRANDGAFYGLAAYF